MKSPENKAKDLNVKLKRFSSMVSKIQREQKKLKGQKCYYSDIIGEL